MLYIIAPATILLNELFGKWFKKIAQSFMFLPYFISWVVAGAIMYNIFNYERGVFNHVLNMLGAGAFDLYNTPAAWPFVLIFLKIWKQTGYGSVVYLAAITGLDQEMFEASAIDGANAWQKIRYITIPSLIPTMMILVLMGIGNRAYPIRSRLIKKAPSVGIGIEHNLHGVNDGGFAAS